MMKNCPFCDLDRKRNRVLKETGNIIVFFSSPRLMPGHLLVVPKRHVEKLSELRKAEREELMETLMMFEEKILKRLAPGCDITQHYRPFLNQTDLKVDHLHFHLRPRKLRDSLYLKCQLAEKNIFKKPSKKELDKLYSLLKD